MKDPDDPYEVTLERAIELIEARIERDKARTLKSFDYKDKPGRVVKGRRSPEIKRNRRTIRLDKSVDGAKLTQKKIEKIIDDELGAKKKTKKKATKKKTVTKKSLQLKRKNRIEYF